MTSMYMYIGINKLMDYSTEANNERNYDYL